APPWATLMPCLRHSVSPMRSVAAQTRHNVGPALMFHSETPVSSIGPGIAGILRLGRSPSLRMTEAQGLGQQGGELLQIAPSLPLRVPTVLPRVPRSRQPRTPAIAVLAPP